MPVMKGAWRSAFRGRTATDVILAVAVAGVVAAAQAADLSGPGNTPLDALGWLLAPVLGGLLLGRRRFPAAVLVASAVALIGYYSLGYPPVGLALPLAGALFSAAEAGRLRWAIGTAAVVLAVSYAYRVNVGQNPGYLFGYELADTLVVLAGAIAAGDAVRSRRTARAQAAERAAMLAARREQEARHAIEEERRRLARDVHDTLAHTVAVISLHSDVALEALPDEPDDAAEALRNVRAASREATRELRGSLALLRGNTASDRHPASSLRDLPGLVDRARDSGLPVTLRVDGAQPLPSMIDSTAYRIVQEALTNVLRHARAASAEVRVRYLPDRVELRVRDDGRGGAPVVPGNGLTGMRERAALLGGTLIAAPLHPHGFAVTASLPLDRAAASVATA